MRAARIIAAVTVTVLPMVAAGCSAGVEPVATSTPFAIESAEPLPSLEEARAAAVRMETEMAGLIPTDWVTDSQQQQERPALRCSGETHYLAGRIVLSLAPSAKEDSILDLLERAYEGSDFSLDRETPLQGERLTFSGANHETYIARVSPTKHELGIASFSACFDLGDRSPHATY